MKLAGRVLVGSEAAGEILVLPEPLSLWGGLDPTTGEVIDRRHPSSGEVVSGKVVAMPVGRGSSSASSVLLEAVRLGTAPAAIVTAEVDSVLALGALVALEMYGETPVIAVLDGESYRAVEAGGRLEINEPGQFVLEQ